MIEKQGNDDSCEAREVRRCVLLSDLRDFFKIVD